ncbi:hypothetical protein [Virgibacillus sp. DJP39]|uniref:hypothetical protein n=1 Tax=Virgibacillus sp. DJP39 TaxID=3409790 RepID=UPI003BB4DBE9
MSESKRVFHVKDLIIKADNVYFDQEPKERHPRRDPRYRGMPERKVIDNKDSKRGKNK